MTTGLSLVSGSVSTTCDSTSNFTISGTVKAGDDPTEIAATISYKDDTHWTMTIAPHAPGSSYVASNWASVDLASLQGTVTDTNGTVVWMLKTTNFVMGSQVMDLNVAVAKDSTGKMAWVGTATLSNTHIGGLTINQVTIIASSLNGTAKLTGSLSTNGGDFAVEIAATGLAKLAGTADPQTWGVSVSISAANLSGAVSTVTFQSFSASATLGQVNATSCVSAKFNISGSWMLEGRAYSFNAPYDDGKNSAGYQVAPFYGMVISCGELKKLGFLLRSQHLSQFSGATITADMLFEWYKPSSTAVSVTQYWSDTNLTIYGGLYATADLEAVRNFSAKYTNWYGEKKTFSRDVTVGIGLTTGLVQWSPGASFSPFVTSGGKLDADRVSGSVGCDWLSGGTDLMCSSKFTWDPSDAGKYDASWGGDL